MNTINLNLLICFVTFPYILWKGFFYKNRLQSINKKKNYLQPRLRWAFNIITFEMLTWLWEFCNEILFSHKGYESQELCHIAKTYCSHRKRVAIQKKGWLYYLILVYVLLLYFFIYSLRIWKKDHAHVLSQDIACTARTLMLSERWWILPNLYARFLAQTSFFLWHILRCFLPISLRIIL